MKILVNSPKREGLLFLVQNIFPWFPVGEASLLTY